MENALGAADLLGFGEPATPNTGECGWIVLRSSRITIMAARCHSGGARPRPGAVLTSVVRISMMMSASSPGVREPTLRDKAALAAPLVELA